MYRLRWLVTGDDQKTDEHFKDLVLIEGFIHNADSKLKLRDFGQQPLFDPNPRSFQVPCSEALLSVDGATLIQQKRGCIHGAGTLRFAFYLHFYDPTRPLMTSYGEILCPPVKPVPVRLSLLVPYRAFW